MILYTMQQAKRDFELGHLQKFSIERVQMTLDLASWRVILGSGKSLGVLVDARNKEQRCFKSLDGAVNALQDIGFNVLALS
jgi:hypothetical protein